MFLWIKCFSERVSTFDVSRLEKIVHLCTNGTHALRPWMIFEVFWLVFFAPNEAFVERKE